jgi:hypothetical protein
MHAFDSLSKNTCISIYDSTTAHDKRLVSEARSVYKIHIWMVHKQAEENVENNARSDITANK